MDLSAGGKKLLLAEAIPLSENARRLEQRTLLLSRRLACALHLPLERLHVEDPRHYPVRETSFEPVFRRIERSTGESSCRETIRLETGRFAELLLRESRRARSYEMIILGIRKRWGPVEQLGGRLAERLILAAERPVLSISEAAAGRKGATELPRRLLLPVSLDGPPTRAERFAASIARRLGAELLLLHVMRAGHSPPAPAGPGLLLPLLREREAARRLEARRRALGRAGLRADTQLWRSADLFTADSILRATETLPVQWVVMGVESPPVFRSFFRGRTARNVALRTELPVLSVRGEGREP